MKPPVKTPPGSSWRVLAKNRTMSFDLYSKHHENSPPSRREGDVSVEFRRLDFPSVFDELVIDDWFHLEQLDPNTWFIGIGENKAQIVIDQDGKPTLESWIPIMKATINLAENTITMSKDAFNKAMAYAQEEGRKEGCNHEGPFSEGTATEPEQRDRNQLYNAGFEAGLKHGTRKAVDFLRRIRPRIEKQIDQGFPQLHPMHTMGMMDGADDAAKSIEKGEHLVKEAR